MANKLSLRQPDREPNTERLSVVVPLSLATRLLETARATDRSVSLTIQILLREALDARI